MGLDLLDTPVRLTWDIPQPCEEMSDSTLLKIAEAIVEGGVFFLTLQGQPLLHPVISDVLESLGGRCQLLVNCRGTDEELERLGLLPTYGCHLLLDASAFMDDSRGVDVERLQQALGAIRQAGFEPILCLTPLRENLSKLPDLLRFCSDHDVLKFKLPNAHIGDSFHDYSPDDLPRWQDLERFKELWIAFLGESISLPAMEIHDLFLWEIMTPGQEQNRSEYGGCQAGNSLGHIDSGGVVHPCAAWPQPLGELPELTLSEIWAGCERLSVREHIAATPQGCQNCKTLDICFGGCRGLSYHLNSDGGERDLMCSGPR